MPGEMRDEPERVNATEIAAMTFLARICKAWDIARIRVAENDIEEKLAQFRKQHQK